MESLRSVSVNAAKWNFIANFGGYLITFFLSIVLARLLDPYEFGLTGMLSVFTAIAVVFISSGFSVALVRVKNVTEEDYSTVFYFNILISLIFYLLFFFLAPYIAVFYNEQELVLITRLISLVFLINSFGIIQNTILIRELNFKKQALCYLSGLGVSTAVSIAMAVKGYGAYSIVGQAVTQAFVTTAAFWLLSKWKPKGWIKKESFKKLWGFGSKILLSNLITQLVDNIDNVLIGRVFSANKLGLYVRAKGSKMIPEQIFANVIQATVFPILSKVNEEEATFKYYHLRFFNVAVYIIFPVVAGFIAVAKSFIIVLYSEKWIASVPMLQIIVITSIAYFLDALFNQTLMARGEGALFLKMNLVKKLCALLSIPVGLFFGLFPFLWTLVGISVFNLFVSFFYLGKILNIHINTYLKKIWMPLLLSFIMGIGTYLWEFAGIENMFVLLVLQIFSGILFYVGLSAVANIDEYIYLKTIIIRRFKKIRKKHDTGN